MRRHLGKDDSYVNREKRKLASTNNDAPEVEGIYLQNKSISEKRAKSAFRQTLLFKVSVINYTFLSNNCKRIFLL